MLRSGRRPRLEAWASPFETARSAPPQGEDGFMPGIHGFDQIKIVDGREAPGHDYHLGLTIDTQKSNASAMAASASAPIQMPTRLTLFSRPCASASRSTV